MIDNEVMTLHIPHLVSIGYEGRSVEDLVRALQLQNVQVLVDVRLTPISRKRGFSKTALSDALAAAGITYVHHRELGNPKDNRDAYRRGIQASRDRFERLLATDKASYALQHVSELLDEGTVALLCFERDHSQCHRDQVVDALKAEVRSLAVTNA